MEKVLEIKDLTKVYKNTRGIKNINLDLYRGEIFGFLGPNGSGKTTTMKIITGLLTPDSGEVNIFGYNIAQNPEKALSKMGCLVETSESYPYLTAYDNLKLYSRYHQIDKKRIDEVLELTGLLKYKNEKSSNFSLGMKQRLGLAAALLPNPELIILDEPLNGLDVTGMLEIRQIIKSLNATYKTTFFISSHLIHDIELTCTRVGLILNGELLGVGNVNEILENYASLENYFVSEVNTNGKL